MNLTLVIIPTVLALAAAAFTFKKARGRKLLQREEQRRKAVEELRLKREAREAFRTVKTSKIIEEDKQVWHGVSDDQVEDAYKAFARFDQDKEKLSH